MRDPPFLLERVLWSSRRHRTSSRLSSKSILILITLLLRVETLPMPSITQQTPKLPRFSGIYSMYVAMIIMFYLRLLSHMRIPCRYHKALLVNQRSHTESSTTSENKLLTTWKPFSATRRCEVPTLSLFSHWQPFLGRREYVHELCRARTSHSPKCRSSTRCVLATMKNICRILIYFSVFNNVADYTIEGHVTTQFASSAIRRSLLLHSSD